MSVFLLIFLVSIFAFNHLGYRYDWYHEFPWYDIPMHVAGGAWVAAMFLYVAGAYRRVSRVIKPSFLRVLGVVLAVGIGWEIYEYSVDIYVFSKYTFSTVPVFILIDSLYDLLNDIIGAVIVLLVNRFYLRKTSQPLTPDP